MSGCGRRHSTWGHPGVMMRHSNIASGPLRETLKWKVSFWRNLRLTSDFKSINFQHSRSATFLRGNYDCPLNRHFNGPQSKKSVYVVFQLSLECCTTGCQRGKGSLIEIPKQLTNLHSLVYGLINILLPRRAKTNSPAFIFSNAFGYGSVSDLVHHLLHNCLPDNHS